MLHRAHTRRWRRLAVLLALTVVVCAAGARLRQHPEQLERSPSSTSTGSASSPQAVRGRPEPTDLRPTGLDIAVIDVSTPLVELGLQPDRTVEVPTDPDRAGWYSLGPAPGLPGSAVILGHVDSTGGPAVFSRLRTLEPGAEVVVSHADGSASRFLVRSIATYANADFPAARVYRNRGTPTLTLVTCGGAYDAAKGGYQANVVVTAGYVGRTENPSSP